MSRSIKATDQREAPIVYFDIELDDCQLTVYEYRAYGRIARRASGGKRSCTESLDSMALGCQMSRRSLINAIKGLIDRRMIARESKLGDTSTYYLTDKSNWIPGASRAQLTSAPDARGVVQEMPTRGAGDARGVVHHVPTKNTSKNTSKNTREEREAQPRQALVVTQAAAIAIPPPPTGGADAVSVVLEYFPAMGIWQQELIEKADINHGILWRQCCERWRDNRYSIRNITGLIDSYHKMEIQDNRERNNNNGKNGTGHKRESHNERAARETRELIEQLTGQTRRDGGTDPENEIFKLTAAFGG